MASSEPGNQQRNSSAQPSIPRPTAGGCFFFRENRSGKITLQDGAKISTASGQPGSACLAQSYAMALSPAGEDGLPRNTAPSGPENGGGNFPVAHGGPQSADKGLSGQKAAARLKLNHAAAAGTPERNAAEGISILHCQRKSAEPLG